MMLPNINTVKKEAHIDWKLNGRKKKMWVDKERQYHMKGFGAITKNKDTKDWDNIRIEILEWGID